MAPFFVFDEIYFWIRMSYQQIAEHLKNNLKDLYRQALDADKRLEAIAKEGLGHHDAILRANEGFRCESKRFMPYLQEIGDDIERLAELSKSEFEANVPMVVKKLQTLNTTLANFKRAMTP